MTSPKLWSTDSPELYSAEIEIAAAGRTLDQTSALFGIRKIEVDGKPWSIDEIRKAISKVLSAE